MPKSRGDRGRNGGEADYFKQLSSLVASARRLDDAAQREIETYAPDTSPPGRAFVERADFIQSRIALVAFELSAALRETRLSAFSRAVKVGTDNHEWLVSAAERVSAGIVRPQLADESTTDTTQQSLRLARQMMRKLDPLFACPVILDDPQLGETENDIIVRPLFVRLRNSVMMSQLSPATLSLPDIYAFAQPNRPPVDRIVTHIAVTQLADGSPETTLIQLNLTNTQGDIFPTWVPHTTAPPALAYQILEWAERPTIREIRSSETRPRPPADQPAAQQTTTQQPRVNLTRPSVGGQNAVRSARTEPSEPAGTARLIVGASRGTRVVVIGSRNERELRNRYAVDLEPERMTELLKQLEDPRYGLFQLSVQDAHSMIFHRSADDPRFRDGPLEQRVPEVRRAGSAPKRGVEHLERWAVFVARQQDDGTFAEVRQVGLNVHARHRYELKQEKLQLAAEDTSTGIE